MLSAELCAEDAHSIDPPVEEVIGTIRAGFSNLFPAAGATPRDSCRAGDNAGTGLLDTLIERS